MANQSSRTAYWKSNILYVSILLSIWALVGYGFSIFFIDKLNTIKIGKVGLGFWFAQQGSILVFVVLVFAYARLMDRLDRKHDVQD